MPKNIVLLSDGTGNSARKLFKTNVWRLYQALDLSEPDLATPCNKKQIAFYDDGVGTASFLPLAIIGGAFGWGTKRNVLDLYTFLCRHYKAGDCIYGFGFSRGAFTIRVLTGLIASQGLVRTKSEGELRHLAAEAFRAYRADRYKHYRLQRWFFRPLRNALLKLWYAITRKETYDRANNRPSPKIKFLGLWDTVAAYGLPIDELTRAWDFIFPLSFPDRNLSDIVECAYHALAIDDERLSFHPELWNEQPSDKTKQPPGDRLTQVWFAGMHSNLGGGYPDDALSGVPLNWILDKSEQAGLVFIKDERKKLREMACINGKKYDSRQGLGGFYRYLPREIETLTHNNEGQADEVVIEKPKIHESVLTRIKSRVDGYAPIGLPEKYEVVNGNGPCPNLMEDQAQAKDRINRQKEVWNLVWWKRIVYFITVTVFCLFAALPFFYRPEAGSYSGPLYVVSLAISGLGKLLPEIISTWVNYYQNHPGLFLLIAGVFAAILYLASRLQTRIFDNMRGIFDKRILKERPIDDPSVAGPPTDSIYKFRSNPGLITSSKVLKEKLIPWAILAIVALLILRGILLIIDSSGLHSPNHGTFLSKNLTWDSGFNVEKGKRYKIIMKINGVGQDQWKDNDIDAFSINGFSTEKMSPPMYLALPLRRHLLEPWFKPIARIGADGSDDYPLDPLPGSDANNLIAEITARNDGELFLFVNDALLPVPKSWQIFYDNNKGNAAVNIEPVN